MYKMQQAKGRRAFDWQPHPILKEGKESTLLILSNHAHTLRAKRLGLSLRGYYKLLARFLANSGMVQEAWICEMFLQKKINHLFSGKRPAFKNEDAERSWESKEINRALQSMDRILLAADILELSKERFKPNGKQRSKLSPAEREHAKTRFRELTRNESADFAYKRISKELSRKGRKVSKETIRRACDKRFARESGCTYSEGKKKNKGRLAFAYFEKVAVPNLDKAW